MKVEKTYNIELTEKERYRLLFLTDLVNKDNLRKILDEKKTHLYSAESLIEIIDDLHESLK